MMLSLYEVIEVRANWVQRFRQRLAFLHRIDRQIKRRDARVAETIDYIRLHQAAVGRQVDEDVSLSAVIDNLVDKLGPQQWFATHQREYARADRMKPIDRTLGDVFSHSLHGIVVRPAIVTIKIAFPFGEQVGNDRTQLGTVPARLKIRRTPTLPGPNSVELLIFLAGHRHRIGFLWINRFR